MRPVARRLAGRRRSTASSGTAGRPPISTTGPSAATAVGDLPGRAALFPADREPARAVTRSIAGPGGRCRSTDLDWRHPLTEAFIEGCVQHGIPRNPDYNGAIQEGVSYVQRNVRNGRRVSAADAFLHPVPEHARTSISARAPTRPGLDPGGQEGPGREVPPRRTHGRRRPTEVRARREVILSGGTYNSAPAPPAVGYRRSGAPALAPAIECRHELPGVGRNLRDHFAPRMTVRVKNIETINEHDPRPERLIGQASEIRA